MMSWDPFLCWMTIVLCKPAMQNLGNKQLQEIDQQTVRGRERLLEQKANYQNLCKFPIGNHDSTGNVEAANNAGLSGRKTSSMFLMIKKK